MSELMPFHFSSLESTMHTLFTRFAVILFLLPLAAHGQESPKKLSDMIKRFAPVTITADISKLSAGDQGALGKLIECAKVMDELYLRQAWSGNQAMLDKLSGTPGSDELHYFKINMGPWSKLDNDEPFIEGAPKPKPPCANYYPEDMTKDQFDAWVAGLPVSQQDNAKGFYSILRRGADKKLICIPYNEEYKEPLTRASKLLAEAAELTTNESLKKFLKLRAEAFLSNDYYASDVAWMDLDSPIEPTIGPYEVYMDELYNYKAAFEAFITIRDDEESQKLVKFSSYLQEVENNLPIDPQYRNPKLGALSPIRVVDEIVTGGESRGGVQTAAYNLPNDERVTKEKGSKRVMLKNVQRAKFEKILTPIAKVAVDEKQLPLVSFEPFFTEILAHELMHGLGPHTITVDGKETTVREQMKELGSALEEAKADISGLFLLQYLIDKGVVEKSVEQQVYATYLAGIFRTLRFGTNDAHGKGMVLQVNFLTDEGAFYVNEGTGTFGVNFEKIKGGVRNLTHTIMTVQAEGRYEKAKALFDKYAIVRPAVKRILSSMNDIPVDIEPHFPLAE
jgi:hypothetical protein